MAAAGTIAAAGALPGSAQHQYQQEDPYRLSGIASHVRTTDDHDHSNQLAKTESNTSPVMTQTYALPVSKEQPVNQQQQVPSNQPQSKSFLAHDPAGQAPQQSGRPTTPYGNWLAPVAGGAAAGAGAGVLAAEADKHKQDKSSEQEASKDATPGSEQAKRDVAMPAGAAAIAPGLREDLTKEGRPASVPTPVAAYPTPTGGSPAATTPAAVTPALAASAMAPTSNPTSEPTAPAPSAAAHSNAAAPVAAATIAATAATATAATSSSEEPATPSSKSVTTRPTSASPASTLSGREREGAHETGHIFPSVVRHDTDMSVSKLHVPGEYNS